MYDDISDEDTYFDLMKEAEDAGYLVAISTLEADFADIYGVLPGHQYTVLACFTLTESDATSHEMIMLRNPWKESTYVGDWDNADSRWTPSLIE